MGMIAPTRGGIPPVRRGIVTDPVFTRLPFAGKFTRRVRLAGATCRRPSVQTTSESCNHKSPVLMGGAPYSGVAGSSPRDQLDYRCYRPVVSPLGATRPVDSTHVCEAHFPTDAIGMVQYARRRLPANNSTQRAPSSDPRAPMLRSLRR
jgi:hypothetical protein